MAEYTGTGETRELGGRYWATEKKGDKLAAHCESKFVDFADRMDTSNYWQNSSRNWDYFNGIFTGGDRGAGSTAIKSIGRGDMKMIGVNHFRELLMHVDNLVTQNRPAFDTEASRADADSMKNAQLGDAIVEDYLVEGKLDKKLRRAVTHGLVLQMGFLWAPWDGTAGRLVDEEQVLDEGGMPIYDEGIEDYVTDVMHEGDYRLSNPSLYDVVWDYSVQDFEDIQWCIVRTFENRFDVATQVENEEDAERIRNMPFLAGDDARGRTQVGYGMFGFDERSETDLVPVYHFVHLDSPGCPGGADFRYCGDGVELGPPSDCNYERLPLFRIVPSEIPLTSFGYSSANDLQGPQEALNSEMSTILTNHSAAGIQAIWVPPGSDLNENLMGDGVLIIEGGQIAPQGVNFAKTPNEFFVFIQKLSEVMEMTSGVNSVARGQPEANMRTGESLKVMDSKAIQAQDFLLRSYYAAIEEVGTYLLRHLVIFMGEDDERLVRVVGEDEAAYVESFKRSMIENITGVRVRAGNALSKTIAGKLAIADNLLAHGFVRTPEEYLRVLNTGQLKALTRSDQAQLDTISDENKHLRAGAPNGPVEALMIDNHALHIREHAALLNKVETRQDQGVASAVLAHILTHIKLLDDVMGARIQIALGYQVPNPPLMPPAGPEGPPPGGGAGGESPTPPGTQAPASDPGNPQGVAFAPQEATAPAAV